MKTSKIKISSYSHRQLRRLARARREKLKQTLAFLLPQVVQAGFFVRPEREDLQEINLPLDFVEVPRIAELLEGYAQSLPHPIRPSDGAPPVEVETGITD